jgi:hypothetical protein
MERGGIHPPDNTSAAQVLQMKDATNDGAVEFETRPHRKEARFKRIIPDMVLSDLPVDTGFRRYGGPRPLKKNNFLFRFVRFSFRFAERIFEGFLADGEGEVAAGFFQHAAHGIGGAAQSVGDGVREIQRDELIINIVHIGEEFLTAGKVAGAHFIQQIAP